MRYCLTLNSQLLTNWSKCLKTKRLSQSVNLLLVNLGELKNQLSLLWSSIRVKGKIKHQSVKLRIVLVYGKSYVYLLNLIFTEKNT
jgi:hypothetical protein